MYSMVLMAALTTGASTPDCFFRGHGCTGSSCYGGSCYGSTSYGCYGTRSYGGSCSGSGYGCYGGGYGCSGSGYGCYGGGYGCSGSGYGCSGASHYSPYSGYGGSGCSGGYSSGGCSGSMMVPFSPYYKMAPAGPAPELVPPPRKDGSESLAPNRAKLIVELPGDATLYIDDHKMNATSPRRVFNTPELERGETYYYIIRAEIVKDGAPVTMSKKVLVTAGQEIKADFRDMTAPTVSAVKLP